MPTNKPYRKKNPVRKPLENKPSSELVRLNKYIANAGVCSRRDADKLIEQGKIKINGAVMKELGYKVKSSDTVEYDGKSLSQEKPVYILLNKPKDFITTLDDPQGRRTVMELIKRKGPERIYPVGRLDRKTTGLLLLTNDGDLAKNLSHPSGEVQKLYEVTLAKPISQDDFDKLEDGIELEDGFVKPNEIAVVSEDNRTLGVQIHIGRNRIVRRMFESLGYEVIRLDRVMYANLTKKDLPRGKWRYLSQKEVIQLKYLK